MTLDQYLGAVAWLFIAFLMWFSVTDGRKTIHYFGRKFKPHFDGVLFSVYVMGPSIFFTCAFSVMIYFTYIGG